MSSEVRFLVAIGLMLVVLVGTNILFPPVVPEESLAPGADSVLLQPPSAPGADSATPTASDSGLPADLRETVPGEGAEEAPAVPRIPTGEPEVEPPPAQPEATAGTVTVSGPLFNHTFSTRGARLVSAELPLFPSLRSDGPVELVPEGTQGSQGHRLVVGQDTVDLRSQPFSVEPENGLQLTEGGPAQTLRFTYQHPTAPFRVILSYTFRPDSYLIDVAGEVEGLDRALLVTDMGQGLAYNEADSAQEARMMAYVGNHFEQGISSQLLSKVEESFIEPGPFLWAAVKSKFFVMAILPGTERGVDTEDYLGGMILEPEPQAGRASVSVTQDMDSQGLVDYQLFLGPLEYARLSALGDDLEEVNPYGWKFFRPIVRPIVGVIMWVLNFLHNTLNVGYGWVLILFGILMRVLLWPLNQKAMRAQMRNMAVQPMIKEIQEKYKDNPERLQKEMMRLYKEYGFNPLAGCLPMLLPWPVLIALFFVFQNTIELRGVPFLWLPDLSAHDPLYILPLFLAGSMFLLQWISYKSMDQDNPQMKMMMYFMPLFFGFIFARFASGLNLYYATANIATIPQQIIIAKERKAAQAAGPVKRKDE